MTSWKHEKMVHELITIKDEAFFRVSSSSLGYYPSHHPGFETWSTELRWNFVEVKLPGFHFLSLTKDGGFLKWGYPKWLVYKGKPQ